MDNHEFLTHQLPTFTQMVFVLPNILFPIPGIPFLFTLSFFNYYKNIS